VKRLVLLACIALLLGPGTARASEITVITYALRGSIDTVNAAGDVIFGLPVFEADQPGPAGLGSRVAVRFESSGGIPKASGQVALDALTVSHALTVPGLLVGHQAYFLTGPVTGGHLSGLVARGSGMGPGTQVGYWRCVAGGASCYALLGVPSFYTINRPFGVTTALAIPFAGAHAYRLGLPASDRIGPNAAVSGSWVFNTAFSQLNAARGICYASTPGGSCTGGRRVARLVGDEIARVTTTPEPRITSLAVVAAACSVLALFVGRRAARLG